MYFQLREDSIVVEKWFLSREWMQRGGSVDSGTWHGVSASNNCTSCWFNNIKLDRNSRKSI